MLSKQSIYKWLSRSPKNETSTDFVQIKAQFNKQRQNTEQHTRIITIINNNNNVYGAVIIAQSHCESSPGSRDECENGAKHTPTLRPGQPTRTARNHTHHRHLLLLFFFNFSHVRLSLDKKRLLPCLLTQLKSWYSFVCLYWTTCQTLTAEKSIVIQYHSTHSRFTMMCKTSTVITIH